jgi:uncharacterized damage-inducible protein DinB
MPRMNPILRDLLDHQLWADVEQWTALAAHPPARDDRVIRERLHHLHLVQRAFVWITGDRTATFGFSKPEEFGSFDALQRFAQESHEQIVGRRDTMSDERLNETITVPWFDEPPLSLTVTEALTQMAMHSQWHRGQNAARLRELGGVPPPTDLIAWYWKQRPQAAW